jgi:ADP-heptose:LPS heptosyltransferase
VGVFGKGEENAAARWLRSGRFDLGILLPNSFRSAWMLWRGGVKRRLGYYRSWRSTLLTDGIKPAARTIEERERELGAQCGRHRIRCHLPVLEGGFCGLREGKHFIRWLQRITHTRWRLGETERDAWTTRGFINQRRIREVDGQEYVDIRLGRLEMSLGMGCGYRDVPTIDYYLELARHLEVESPSRRTQLHITPAERQEAEAALMELGVDAADDPYRTAHGSASGKGAYVVMAPGARLRTSKCWLPERYAAVAEALAAPMGSYGAKVMLVGSPEETPLCQAIKVAMRRHGERVSVLGTANGGKGVTVGGLKEVVRRARLIVCNDTGPRHIAAALEVPVVTLFGPTDPAWAETFFAQERIVRVMPPCGPCRLEVCPIDHRCMTAITTDMVLRVAEELWQGGIVHTKQDGLVVGST